MPKDSDSSGEDWMDEDVPLLKKKTPAKSTPAAKSTSSKSTPAKTTPAAKAGAAKGGAAAGKGDKAGKDSPAAAKGAGAKKPPAGAKAKKEPAPKDIAGKTADQVETEEEGKRLRKRTRAIGTLASTSAGKDQELCEGLRLKPSPAIRKHSTQRPVEVFKKATNRKNKALFLFPGLISVMQEGKMGQVHDLDKNPILDIDFPTGKLRLRGTYVHTEGKFLSLLPKGKRITAQDVFDQVVVFSEHIWLGPADQDPTGGGGSSKIPDEAYKTIHSRVTYEGGASCGEDASSGKGSKGQVAGQQSIMGFMDGGQSVTASDGSRVRRAAAQGVKYKDGDERDDGDDDEDDDDDDAIEIEQGTRSPVTLPIPHIPEAAAAKFARSKAAGASKKTPTKKKPEVEEEGILSSGSGSESERRGSGDDEEERTPPSKQKARAPARASASKKTYVIDSGSEDDKEEDDDDDDEPEVISSDGGESDDDEPVAKKAKPSPAPRKKPAAPAKKKEAAPPKKKAPMKKKSKGSESEDGDESEDEEEEDSEDEKPAKKKATPAKKPTPKKAPAKKAAPKKNKKGSDSEEESESEEASEEEEDGWSP